MFVSTIKHEQMPLMTFQASTTTCFRILNRQKDAVVEAFEVNKNHSELKAACIDLRNCLIYFSVNTHHIP